MANKKISSARAEMNFVSKLCRDLKKSILIYLDSLPDLKKKYFDISRLLRRMRRLTEKSKQERSAQNVQLQLLV